MVYFCTGIEVLNNGASRLPYSSMRTTISMLWSLVVAGDIQMQHLQLSRVKIIGLPLYMQLSPQAITVTLHGSMLIFTP